MRRSTVVFLVLMLITLGAYYFVSKNPKKDDTAATTPIPTATEVSYLFTSDSGTPKSIHIESSSGETVEVARIGNVWQVTKPIWAAADQGSIEAAVTQITTMSIVNRVKDVTPKDVGLDVPSDKIVIQFTNGAEQNVEIGVLTPTETGYYVRVNNGDIVIISKSAIDALTSMLTTPPFIATATPPLPATPATVAP